MWFITNTFLFAAYLILQASAENVDGSFLDSNEKTNNETSVETVDAGSFWDSNEKTNNETSAETADAGSSLDSEEKTNNETSVETVDGSSGNASYCDTDSDTICLGLFPPNTFPQPYPENESELDYACSLTIKFKDCEKHYVDTCDPPYKGYFLKRFDKEYTTLMRMCDEDSALHKALGRNMMCIKKMIKTNNETCFEEKQAILQAYISYLGYGTDIDMAFEVMTDEDYFVFFCLEHALKIACFLKNVEECGTEAKDVSLELIRSSEYHLNICFDGAENKVLSLLGNLQLENHQEKSIREVLLMNEGNK